MNRADPHAGRYYLAGPMRGIPLYNFPAFESARSDLRVRYGFNVFCPAEADVAAGFDPETCAADTLAAYMERDLPEVCRSVGVIVLPGWRASQGARLEVMVAAALGLPVYAYPSLAEVETEATETTEPSETILEEANRIIHGPRREGYGHPLENFSNTAALWTAHLRNRNLLGHDAEVRAEDVGWMMVQVKQAREYMSHARDNLTDAAGYVGTIQMCIEKRADLPRWEVRNEERDE